ncbi:VOC family protein [Geopsychrobacter electrodiphilus]|uniref:VOC family protein n=1 Tax=Geopsychrobacter electrodiphilus TaxID=225196 RepID=UPI0003770E15|nr:VOC family protein [Geopsychrobacter electrodiphilus]
METETIVFDHVHLLSENPSAAAEWYVDMLDGKITANIEVGGAPQVTVDFIGAKIIIRGQRSGEEAVHKKALYWGTDHFGFRVTGDLDRFCQVLKQKGAMFTLEPVDFGPKVRIAFIQAPDGVSIELLKRKI